MNARRKHNGAAAAVGGMLCAMTAAVQARADAPTLSARAEVAPETLYERQVFDLTLVVSSTGLRLAPEINLAELPSASALKLGAFSELPVRRALRDGTLHEVRRFRCRAHARRAGRVLFEPRLDVTVLRRRRLLIGSRLEEIPRSFRAQRLALVIKPLPAAERPADFSGAVGSFSLDVRVEPRHVAVGDLIRSVISVRGSGLLDGVRLPRFSPGRDFKVYDPRVLPGSTEEAKTVEQILIPQNTNAAALPAVGFSFFDPRTAAYRELRRGPFALSYHRGRPASEEPYRPPPDAGGRPEEARERPAVPGLKAAPGDVAGERAERYRKAAEAYADGYAEAAVDTYRELLAEGDRSAALFYNLGNAGLAAGRRGAAVLNYLRALELAPGDAETRRNLVALNVPLRSKWLWRHPWSALLPVAAWSTLAVVFAAAGLAALMFRPRYSGRAVAAAAWLCLAGALATGWLSYAAGPGHRPDRLGVTMRPCTARLAPAPSALAVFTAPEGALVRRVEQGGEWTRVRYRGSAGWLPAEALHPVSVPD